MTSASDILRRRNRAEILLETLLEEPSSVNVIHYACENFDNPAGEGSPRVTVIAIRQLGSGQTDTFSLGHEAELANVPAARIKENLDTLERNMLCKFYARVRMNRSHRWLHWNMRDSTYGFNAIAKRFRVLGQEPIEIPDALLYDLSHILTEIYGEDYVSHPRMKTVLQINGRMNREFLTGAEEADAFDQGEYSRISKSTLRKTHEFAIIARKARERSLNTEKAFHQQHGIWLGTQLLIEVIHAHWLFKLLVIASVIFSSASFVSFLFGMLQAG